MGEETARLRQEIDRTRENLTRDVDQLADRTSPSRVVQRRVQRTRRGLTGLKDRVMGSGGSHDEPDRTGTGLGYADFGYATYADDVAVTPRSGWTGSGVTPSGVTGASFAGRGDGDDASAGSHSVSAATAQAAQSVRGSVQHVGDRAGETVSEMRSGVSEMRSGVREQTEGNPLAAGLVAFGVGWLVSSLLPSSRIEAQAAQRAGEVAREHGGPLVDQAKQSVQEMGNNLQGPAQDAVAQVKDRAQDAAGTVREEAGTTASEQQDPTRTQGGTL